MSTGLFYAAGGLAALWGLVHLFLGGREVARPLRDDAEMLPILRRTLYLCWHLTTAAIASMAALFVWAALSGRADLAVAGTLLAAAFALAGIGSVFVLRVSHLALPQGWLFLPVAGFGLAGLLA